MSFIFIFVRSKIAFLKTGPILAASTGSSEAVMEGSEKDPGQEVRDDDDDDDDDDGDC